MIDKIWSVKFGPTPAQCTSFRPLVYLLQKHGEDGPGKLCLLLYQLREGAVALLHGEGKDRIVDSGGEATLNPQHQRTHLILGTRTALVARHTPGDF